MSKNKAILTIDYMPDKCLDCPLHSHVEWVGSICAPESYKAGMANVNLYKQLTNNELMYNKPNWCPLRRLPKKNAETVDAIPIEWLRKWEEKHKNDPCYCNFVTDEILADWEKENEGKTN